MTTTTTNIYELAENIKKKVSMSEYLKKITKEELYERL